MRTLRVLSAMMVLALLVGLVASCASPAATPTPTPRPAAEATPTPPPPPEKTILRITFSWPTYIDPAVGSDFSSSSSLCNLYDTLVFPTTEGGVVPNVAESWETSAKGRGTVVTGRVDRGTVKVGDEVDIVGLRDGVIKRVVTGVEMFHKTLDVGQAGDNLGCLLRGIDRDEVERGMVLAKPGSIEPHIAFTGEVYVLRKDEGGRHTPFFAGYRPQFFIRTMDVTGSVELPAGVEMVMPGDHVNLNVKLIEPVALETGSRFAIREGGRTVGAGVITEILN